MLHRSRRLLVVVFLLPATAIGLQLHHDESQPRVAGIEATSAHVAPLPQKVATQPATKSNEPEQMGESPQGATLTAPVPDPSPHERPLHWRLGGSAPDDYSLVVDRSTVWNGTGSGRLAATKADASPYSYGALVQTVSAAQFRNKAIQLSALVRTEGVLAGAALWIRADDADGNVVAFDNMHNRMFRKTTPWTKHAIVIGIPAKANVISFGCLLSGRGLVWIDDVQLAEVDPAAAKTTPPMHRLQQVRQTYAAWPPLDTPANLDFEAAP